MRPLREIDPESLRRLRGVVFDIDDTVTREGRVEAAAFAAMWELARAGLHLVAVTGRPLGWADVLARLWPVRLVVGENGSGWAWTEGGVLREGYFLAPEPRRRAVMRLHELRLRVAEAMPHVRVTGDDRARRCDLAFDVGESEKLAAADISRLRGIIEDAGMRCSISSVHAHAVAGDWDKASAATRAALDVAAFDLEVERDRWLFIGDSGNDAAAFAFFPLSVGVANVRAHLEHLPSPPRWVTDGDRGLGFAEMARSVLEARS